MGWLTWCVVAFNVFVLVYFLILNSIYLGLFLLSLAEVMRFVRRTFFSDYRQIMQSEMTWPISILVAAHNEEKTIVETVRSLMMVNYGEFEIVVINDGSTDETLKRLVQAFELRRMDRVYRRSIPTEPVHGVFGSLAHANLTVVDKEKGGKSDALNAGINLSRFPLFCSIDADSIIEDNALLRVVKPFMERPAETVAAGGIVRIVNGCEVRDGRVVRIELPDRPLAIFQVVEYLRAFLTGRVGWSVLRSLLIISGAFGIYKKDEVVEIGGYSRYTDTEDLELVVRLHEHMRRKKRKYRVVFVPDPVCWTEVPERIRVLNRQRNRWHRGLVRTLWTHKRMLFNPRYGAIGLFAFPYFFLFEMLGPFVEVLGYAAVLLSYLLGILNLEFFLLFLGVAVLYGIFLSIAAILLEEISFRRYPGWLDLTKLVVFGILENFGYRQMNAVFKVKAFWDVVRRRRAWGRMDRAGFRSGQARQAAPQPGRAR
ncbi:MAG: glycosyltransferase [Acidobacteriia bacterium]|nr:glycosyltransferase [Terriglobia bacterium]